MSLEPAQRVTLIIEISTRLSVEGWPLIDVTLDQFGLPTNPQWDGEKQAYVIESIQKAPDHVLIDLAQHVGFNFQEQKPGIDPPFWRAGMLRIFLTHLATQRKFAAELQEELLRFGISCFVAHNDIEPTAEWQGEIETALATCDALVALLHAKFHESNWTDQEIGFVMGRGLPIFAVHFGQDPYGFIGRFQAFNGKDKDTPALVREIFDAFCKHKQTQRKMADVLLGLFEQSGSFDSAKARISRLEEMNHWEPSYAPRLRSAVKGNSQIADAWGVPERVEALIAKWESSF